MENKSKKSKALIITIIAVIILVVVGYFLFKNRANIFGINTSSNSNIFSPLDTSKNSKTTMAQAGEDIKKGDSLSNSGTNVNNNPIVVKANNNSNVFGFANEDIFNGEMGEITLNIVSANSFWDSFSGFLENIFNPPTFTPPDTSNITIPDVNITIPTYSPQCSDEIDNDNDGTIDINDSNCLDVDGNYLPLHYSESVVSITIPTGTTYTPQCSDGIDNDNDGTIDAGDQNCLNADGNYLPLHYSESNSPIIIPDGSYLPQCSDTKDNDADTFVDIDDPNCHNADGEYLPLHYSESTSPITIPPWEGYLPQCSDTKDNDADSTIDASDPNCHTDNDPDNNLSYVPKHYSESVSPFVIPEDEEGVPDLVAGSVTPTSTILNTPTKLSSIVANIGNGSTGSSFTAFFSIGKLTKAEKDEQEKSDTMENENEIISKSGLKNTIVNIFKKITSISKVIAENNTAGEVELSDLAELRAVVPTLPASISNVTSITHTFTSTGTYRIRACADKNSPSDTGIITESNEENNCGPWTIFVVTNSLPTGGDLPQCSDTLDNDEDSRVDFADPNCHLDGDMSKEYMPDHDDEANSPISDDLISQYECSDTLDNDKDGKIDINDRNCHLDGDMTKDYVSTHDDESTSPTTPEVNECLLIENHPLTFTDKEKAELAQLLRKFYLIAPTLKTEEDINLIYSEIAEYESFNNQLDELINECYDQGIDRDGNKNPDFTLSPAHRFGNPWFKPEERGREVTELYTRYERFDEDNPLWGTEDRATIDCKLVAGYFIGTTPNGQSCDELYTPEYTQGDCYIKRPNPAEGEEYCDTSSPIMPWDADCHAFNPLLLQFMPGEKKTMMLPIPKECKWVEGTYFQDIEYLLNIW